VDIALLSYSRLWLDGPVQLDSAGMEIYCEWHKDPFQPGRQMWTYKHVLIGVHFPGSSFVSKWVIGWKAGLCIIVSNCSDNGKLNRHSYCCSPSLNWQKAGVWIGWIFSLKDISLAKDLFGCLFGAPNEQSMLLSSKYFKTPLSATLHVLKCSIQ
jgi:hypothetical protein